MRREDRSRGGSRSSVVGTGATRTLAAMSPDDATAAARAAYDAGAATYADRVGTTMSDQFERWLDRAFLDEFAERMAGTPELVVDAGCGTGRVTALLGERGVDVVGIDASGGML